MLNNVDSDGDGTTNGVEAETARSGGGVGFSPGLVGSSGTDPCGSNTAFAVTNVCETPTDSDGDGTINCSDGCPNDATKTAPGVCGCGVPDADGDGTLNCLDGGPNDAAKTSPDSCGCSVADVDANSNSVPDCVEGGVFTVNTTNDTIDANVGDGICADASGNCSLRRAAIMEANFDAHANTIVLPGVPMCSPSAARTWAIPAAT